MTHLKILGLSGSHRAGSTNTQLLQVAGRVAPAGVELSVYDYRDVPLYSGDLEIPESVTRLTNAIQAADAVIIATPEYNYSISGVLKNAIDWASRPAYASVFRGKPTGILSTSGGLTGGARAQAHLRDILAGMVTPVFPWPELLVAASHKKFQDGEFTDEIGRDLLEQYMVGFADWARSTR